MTSKWFQIPLKNTSAREMATTETQPIKRLTLSISQVAPLIGLDNYGNFPRVVCEVWRRFNPAEFRDFELRMKSAGHALANASELNDIWETDDLLGTNILEQVRALNNDTNKTSAEMTKSQAVISEYINQHARLSNTEKAELVKKVCSVTNKSHGVTNEDAILAEFCALTDKRLTGTQGWVEIKLAGAAQLDMADCAMEWVVIGKYDGVTTDGELVEAKMRQKGLFKSMRDYENVQVQLYLHALGALSGYLVEGFSSSSKTAKAPKANKLNMEVKQKLIIYIHDLAYDASYVEEIILARLRNFTSYFKELMLDTARKEKILKSDASEYAKYREEYLGIEEIVF